VRAGDLVRIRPGERVSVDGVVESGESDVHRLLSIRLFVLTCLLGLVQGSLAANQVVAWGNNSYGQTDVPTFPRNVVAIASGTEHSLALRADGTVAAWGDNTHRQAINSELVLNNVQVTQSGAYSVTVTNAYGVFTSPEANLSVTTFPAWGANLYGQTNVLKDLTNIVAIAAGFGHSLALRSEGRVVVWGSNIYDQTNMPAGVTNVIAIAAGDLHSLALKSDGTVVAWGADTTNSGEWPNFGQSVVPPGLTNVVAISGRSATTQGAADQSFAQGRDVLGVFTDAERPGLRPGVQGGVGRQQLDGLAPVRWQRWSLEVERFILDRFTAILSRPAVVMPRPCESPGPA